MMWVFVAEGRHRDRGRSGAARVDARTGRAAAMLMLTGAVIHVVTGGRLLHASATAAQVYTFEEVLVLEPR